MNMEKISNKRKMLGSIAYFALFSNNQPLKKGYPCIYPNQQDRRKHQHHIPMLGVLIDRMTVGR